MKKIKSILLLVLLLVISCRENIVDFSDIEYTGNLYINSNPRGADIYLNDSRLGKTTPDSLINLQPGLYSVKLILLGYLEETVFVHVLSKQKRYINVNFRLD